MLKVCIHDNCEYYKELDKKISSFDLRLEMNGMCEACVHFLKFDLFTPKEEVNAGNPL